LREREKRKLVGGGCGGERDYNGGTKENTHVVESKLEMNSSEHMRECRPVGI
jgi:hypothetical protein